MDQPPLQVAILVAGSADREAVAETEQTLRDFGIGFEIHEFPASANPGAVRGYLAGANDRGVRLLIAVAGQDVWLPARASRASLAPVIGIPLTAEGLHALGNLAARLTGAEAPGPRRQG